MRFDGARLRERRKASGQTLEQVADWLGVSNVTVHKWEKGTAKPLDHRLEPLATVLGCSVNDLHSPASPTMATLGEMQAWARGIMVRRPDFVIGDDYLRRWFVVPRNPWLNVYLHDIRKSDDDRAFHDHPWGNTSFIISGGYVEHTPEGRFVRRAGDVVTREATQLHRLEVLPGERAVSLFVTGPKVREWGFQCEQGWVHWQDFTSEHDSSQTGRGCGEPDDPTPVTLNGYERGRGLIA